MISRTSEITDAKGRKASRDWVFFDRDCRICIACARLLGATLERRGFGLAALQDPRSATLLGLPPDQLLREMRLITAEDGLCGGADAVILLARRIWWAWPLYAAAQLPGMRPILRATYRGFANQRRCACGRFPAVRSGHQSGPVKRTKGESR